MARTTLSRVIVVVSILALANPVLVHSDPLFFKNSNKSNGKRPKFFWDIFGVFGSKEEPTSSSYGPPSSYGSPGLGSSNPSYLPPNPAKPTYNPVKPSYESPKPSYGPTSSSKPSYKPNGSTLVVTNKPSYFPPSNNKPSSSYNKPSSSYSPPSNNKPTYLPQNTNNNNNPSYLPPGPSKPSYQPSSQGTVFFPPSATNSQPTFLPPSGGATVPSFTPGRPNFPPATNPPVWPSRPVNFGDGDLPNYNRPGNNNNHNNFGVSGPDQFGLVVTQPPFYQPCECSQHFATPPPTFPIATTIQQTYFPTPPPQNQPEYRPQITQVFEVPSTSTTIVPISTTILTTEVSVTEFPALSNSTLDPFQAEVISNGTSTSEDLSRLEEPKAEPASTTGDGWVPMTLQKVMDIVTGGDFNDIHPKRQFQLQRKPKISKPGSKTRPNFRSNPSEKLKDRLTNSKNDFREPRTGARHMKHDSPKSRLKHLDFKVSDPEITTTTTSTTTAAAQTTTASSTDSSTIRKEEHLGDSDDENEDEKVLIVFPENHVMGEALDKRRLKSGDVEKKAFFHPDNFDHGLNTLATLAQTDFDLLSTTERSGKQLDINNIDDYNLDDGANDEYGSHNVVGFIGSNETKWVWKLQDVNPKPPEEDEAVAEVEKLNKTKDGDQPHKFEQLRVDSKSTVTLPSASPFAESDFVLLSDAWFKNYSSLPEISPSAFNLTDEGLIFDTETIDLTSHSKEQDDDHDDNNETEEEEDKFDYVDGDEDDLEKIENTRNKNAGRKPKNLNDPDLVRFYPMHGKPFLSFQPEVQISNIVKSDSII